MITDATAGPAVVNLSRRKFQVIIFDLDGVLANSFSVMREAFRVAYAETVGPGIAPFTEYRKHMGRSLPSILRDLGLPKEMEAPFVRESYRLADRVTVYDGVPEMLRSLREHGILLGVATGKSGSRARSLLERLCLLPYFNLVVGSDEVERPKPAPDIIHTILASFGTPASAAMMVGDSAADIQSGKAAGLITAAAVWGCDEEDAVLAQRPDVVLRYPDEILSLVGAFTHADIA